MSEWRRRDLADMFDTADFERWPAQTDKSNNIRRTLASTAYIAIAAEVLAKTKPQLLDAAEAYLEHDVAFVELLESLADAEALFGAHAELVAEARARLMMASAKIVFSGLED